MIVCLRCGQCCGKCPMLLKIDGFFICAIYENRLGFKLSDRKCVERRNLKKNFAGCPYNV